MIFPRLTPFPYPFSLPARAKLKKAAIFTATMVDPTGVSATMAISMPKTAQITETTAAQIVTDRKLLYTRMADKAGKIIRAEISRDPTRFMARTMQIIAGSIHPRGPGKVLIEGHGKNLVVEKYKKPHYQ